MVSGGFGEPAEAFEPVEVASSTTETVLEQAEVLSHVWAAA